MIEWDQLEKALCDIWKAIREITPEIRKIVTELQKRSVTVDKVIANQVVLPVNTWNGATGNKGYYESPPVENAGHCCGRVLIDVAFDISATGGISVDMYYKSEKIGEVIKVPCMLQTTGGASASLDIANLSGFHFIVVNHDPAHAVTISHFRIVMWGVK